VRTCLCSCVLCGPACRTKLWQQRVACTTGGVGERGLLGLAAEGLPLCVCWCIDRLRGRVLDQRGRGEGPKACALVYMVVRSQPQVCLPRPCHAAVDCTHSSATASLLVGVHTRSSSRGTTQMPTHSPPCHHAPPPRCRRTSCSCCWASSACTPRRASGPSTSRQRGAPCLSPSCVCVCVCVCVCGCVFGPMYACGVPAYRACGGRREGVPSHDLCAPRLTYGTSI
jgi:hypothetical protein